MSNRRHARKGREDRAAAAPASTTAAPEGVLRQPAETAYREELEALRADAERQGGSAQKPDAWQLPPKHVVDFVMGARLACGFDVTAKYIGPRALIETAVATLATNQALLLCGVPGTAKSRVSELIAAAISGSSELLIQCTAGTDEAQVRYGWNYAMLIGEGPSRRALVPTPLMSGMEAGTIVRLEEINRMASEVQDTLSTILSEKTMPVPELNSAVHAVRGFNIIATANDRDRGINEPSSALMR